MLQLKNFRTSQREKPYIRVNIRELNRVPKYKVSTLYTNDC